MKTQLTILEEELQSNITPEEQNKIEYLHTIDYTLYTPEDKLLLRKFAKYNKPIKRLKRRIKNQLKWEQKVSSAPEVLSELNEKIQGKKLFSMDLEFHETTRQLTEVGITIFEDEKIQAYHFIVLETKQFKNGRFVPDNKFHFDYGESQILPLEAIQVIVGVLFKGTDFLVGHAFGNDKPFLYSCDIDIDNIAVLDTQRFAPLYLLENKTHNLKTLVESIIGVKPIHLHNGGNDSYYTLLVLLKIAKREPELLTY